MATEGTEKSSSSKNGRSQADDLKFQEACVDGMTSEQSNDDSPPKPYIRLQPFMSGLRELRTPGLWRDVICEVLVTFLLLFFITGIGANFATPDSPSTPLLLAAVGAGLQVFALIECFGHVQLAAMNPAACIYFILTGKVSVFKGLLLTTAECLGSILGAALIYSCSPPSARMNFQPLGVHPDISPWQGVAMEWVITANLILVLSGALDDRNRKVYIPGLPVGLSVAAGIMTAGNFTGGALNPMITFGPAVVTGIWKNQWVYWAGPLLGGLTGTLLYHGFTYDKGVFRKPTEGDNDPASTRKKGEYIACRADNHHQEGFLESDGREKEL